MSCVQPSAPTADDERYEYERMLGQGGAGAVYLVRDRETGEQLALKKLFRMDSRAVLRLKREFRSLADVHHPNLVKLYDLGQTSDAWFLTMEYVRGRDLLAYVDGDDEIGDLASRARLRSAFYQLACGVRTLHRAGMLHRDLKPSNVLVCDDGRVVVLDFGLVRELDASALRLTEDGSIAGTPAYMAPEQATNQELSEASDWYAFGAMLYEALSGELPFDGTMLQVLRMKLAIDPKPLERLVPDVPRALGELCMALLCREPEDRPNGDEVLRVLDPAADDELVLVPTTDLSVVTEAHAQPAAATLIGRDRELAQLGAAFERVLDGESVVVHVCGASGAGKSALVERFLYQLEERNRRPGGGEVLVLRSRCYEREAMPFKALDGLMDALVRHLARWADIDAGHMLPADIAVLTRLFPVLERLHAVQRLLHVSKPRAESPQDRQRAEQALRDLFGGLAARQPLVLWIDDLQWGDLDSAGILAGWLDTPHDPAVLLVFSYRSDEATTSSCLRQLISPAADGGGHRTRQERIELPPLAPADVQALCAERLGELAGRYAGVIDRIAQESQGSPFLASQLAALAEAKIARGDTDVATLSLDDLVAQTSALLPADAKLLLATLAVAGRPMHVRTLLRAAGIKREGRNLLHALRGLNLVRTRDVGGERLIEAYHDRVRERVQSGLRADERQRVHDNLLRALEWSDQADPYWLFSLAHGAGQRPQALHYGLLAAERASATLAFERAAELYERCIELSDAPVANGGELYLKLARALVNSGRGGRAADAYRKAARFAAPDDTIELTRLAASQLLRSGRFEEGEREVQKVLEAMRIHVPQTPASLMAAIVWERTRLSLRGKKFVKRSEREVPASMLAQVDVYDLLRLDTQAYEPLRATLFQLRGMRLALEAGEPKRIVRALCSAANIAATTGEAEESSALLARAATLARELGHERAYANVCSSRAVCAFSLGRPRDVLEAAHEAERIYRGDAERDESGDYYRRFFAVWARIGALHALGDNRRFASEVQAALQEARATENIAAELLLTVVESYADELAAQAERARPRLERQEAQLPMQFGMLHGLHLVAVLRTACATSDYDWGEARTKNAWGEYLGSPLRRISFVAYVAHAAHVRMVLNQHVRSRAKTDPEPLVREDLRALAKLSPHDKNPTVERTLARLALLRGDRARAVEHLQRSVELRVVHESPDDATRDRYALGVLSGGDEGRALCARTTQELLDNGHADPSREFSAHYPELVT